MFAMLQPPEIFLLSPWEFPLAWLGFLSEWGGAAVCICLSWKLWRKTSARGWLILSSGYLISLLFFVARSTASRVPLWPHGYILQTQSFPAMPDSWSGAELTTFQFYVRWDLATPIVAIALWFFLRDITPRLEREG